MPENDAIKRRYGYSADEILHHYGHDPGGFAKGKRGKGIWEKERAFEQLESVPYFLKLVDKTKKIRIEFDYDPDFPAALIVTDCTLKR